MLPPKKFFYRKNRIWIETLFIGMTSILVTSLISGPGSTLFTTWWAIPLSLLFFAILFILIHYSYLFRTSFGIKEEHLFRQSVLQKNLYISGSTIRRITVRDQPGLFNKKYRVMRISSNSSSMLTIHLSDLKDSETFLREVHRFARHHQIPLIFQNKDGRSIPEKLS